MNGTYFDHAQLLKTFNVAALSGDNPCANGCLLKENHSGIKKRVCGSLPDGEIFCVLCTHIPQSVPMCSVLVKTF